MRYPPKNCFLRKGAQTAAIWVLATTVGTCHHAFATPAAAPSDLNVPAKVLEQQDRQDRWIVSFNSWRSAKWVWPGETRQEGELRREMRLIILPTITPLLGAQRRLDGPVVVISSGLIAMIDELLLAETLQGDNGDKGCFDLYGNHVMEVVRKNHAALREVPARHPSAWPRFRGLIGSDRYLAKCPKLKSYSLQNSASDGKHIAATTAMMLWMFNWHSIRLSKLPDLSPPPKPVEVASAAANAKETAATVAQICPAAVATDYSDRAHAASMCIGYQNPHQTIRLLLDNRTYLLYSGDLDWRP
jgi:hypothetical protein